MSLYRKYRPAVFEDMIGDFLPLLNLSKQEVKPHTFLFTGPSGCGKTTAARILAEELGANEMDIYEYNASDKNGVDDMRAIIDNINIASFSKAKVYILDEFHKVTDAGQNCLLKALEDTPPHVYFVLCSSDPNKVIKAVKTRCTTIHFPPLKEDDIFALLKDVCKKEEKKVKSDILDKIAEISDGSARQALVLLESIIATTEDSRLDKLNEIGYGTESPQAIDLMRMIFSKSSWKETASLLLALKEAGADGEGLRRAILGYGTAILLKNKFDPTLVRILACFVTNVFDSGFNGFVLQCAKAYDIEPMEVVF